MVIYVYPHGSDKTPVASGKGGTSTDLATLTGHSAGDHSGSHSGGSKTGKQNGLKKVLGGGKKKKEITGSGDDAVPNDKTPLAKPIAENA